MGSQSREQFYAERSYFFSNTLYSHELSVISYGNASAAWHLVSSDPINDVADTEDWKAFWKLLDALQPAAHIKAGVKTILQQLHGASFAMMGLHVERDCARFKELFRHKQESNTQRIEAVIVHGSAAHKTHCETANIPGLRVISLQGAAALREYSQVDQSYVAFLLAHECLLYIASTVVQTESEGGLHTSLEELIVLSREQSHMPWCSGGGLVTALAGRLWAVPCTNAMRPVVQ